MGNGLEGDAAYRRMLYAEPDDIADLVVVHSFLDGGNQDHVEFGLGQPVEGFQLEFQEVLASYGLVGLGREAVELEVDRGAYVGQAGQEAVVPGDAYPVGVEHYDGDALVECHPQHRQDFRVDGGLAPAELDYLRLALQLDEPVQHPLDLFH